MTDDQRISVGVDRPIDRRKFIAALSAAGAAAVAGCTEDPDDSDNETGGDTETLVPPELRFDPAQLDEPYAFIVRSLHYQNQVSDDE